MYPWLWVWAPQLNLPGSGSVSQLIEPDTNWFFGSIKPDAGNGRVEKRAFDVASYGKQIGLLGEVLVALAEQQKIAPSSKAGKSLARLKGIQSQIEDIKASEAALLAEELETQFMQLQKSSPKEFASLLARLAPALKSISADP